MEDSHSVILKCVLFFVSYVVVCLIKMNLLRITETWGNVKIVATICLFLP